MAQKTPEPGTEAFAAGLPRSMDGEDLRILSGSPAGIVVTDGTRTALYVPQGEGPGLRDELQVMNGYTEAGWFMEANCLTIGNGNATAIYIPARIVSVEH